jgi:hypothetical protein
VRICSISALCNPPPDAQVEAPRVLFPDVQL